MNHLIVKITDSNEVCPVLLEAFRAVDPTLAITVVITGRSRAVFPGDWIEGLTVLIVDDCTGDWVTKWQDDDEEPTFSLQ